jgi:hypothetical protein
MSCVAEMKPLKKTKNVSFWEFKSRLDVAWAVDAAFYNYSKRHLLNFSDSTNALSMIRQALDE